MSLEQQQQLLWNQFLALWPIERVRKMTLEEYSQAGNKDNFTYWLERETTPSKQRKASSTFNFGYLWEDCLCTCSFISLFLDFEGAAFVKANHSKQSIY